MTSLTFDLSHRIRKNSPKIEKKTFTGKKGKNLSGEQQTGFVRSCMENLEKAWNFKMVISRPGKVMEKKLKS